MSTINTPQPPSYLYQVGLCNAIMTLSQQVVQTGIVTAQPLHTLPLSGGALVVDGQCISVLARGNHAGNTGSKSLIARINSINQMIVTLPATPVTLGWYLFFYLHRASSGQVGAYMRAEHGHPISGTAPSAPTIVSIDKLISVTPGVDFSVEFLATIPSAGDTIQQLSTAASII